MAHLQGALGVLLMWYCIMVLLMILHRRYRIMVLLMVPCIRYCSWYCSGEQRAVASLSMQPQRKPTPGTAPAAAAAPAPAAAAQLRAWNAERMYWVRMKGLSCLESICW